MAAEIKADGDPRSLLAFVAILSVLPERGLLRGQIGVIVETLGDATALVEFSDDQGRAHAIAPCPREVLLVLRTMPRAASTDELAQARLRRDREDQSFDLRGHVILLINPTEL
jgi:hypothetical protein